MIDGAKPTHSSHSNKLTIPMENCLEPKITQSWMVIRAAALRPMKFPVSFFDEQVIDTRITPPH
jgi:hypothetical protein